MDGFYESKRPWTICLGSVRGAAARHRDADAAMSGDGPARILVIDDDELIRDTVRDVLEDAGHEVIEAANGPGGLELLGRDAPSLVICDVRMPGMSGYQVLQEMRERHGHLARVPFLFLSNLATSDDLVLGLDVGADDYLPKPVDNAILLRKVEAALRQASRVETLHRREQVKLYKALSKGPPAAAAPAPPATRPAEPVVRGHGAVGFIHFVNLDDLRLAYGASWDALADKAMALAESTIRRSLGPAQGFERQGETGFVLRFPDLDRDAAQLQGEEIAARIYRVLLGEDTGNFRSLRLVADAEAAVEYERRGADAEREAGGEGLSHFAATPDDAGWMARQVVCRFQPILNLRREMVVAYHVQPVRSTAYGVFSGEAALHGGTDDPARPDLDLLMARGAVDLLTGADGGAGDEPVPLWLPVHVATVAGPRRDALEAELERCPRSTLRRLLQVEIVGVGRATPLIRVQAVTRLLGRYASHVIVRGHPETVPAAAFRHAGADGFSLDLDAPPPGTTRQALLDGAAAFAAAARRLDCNSWVSGAHGLVELNALIAARVTLVSGRVVDRAQERPRSLYKLSRGKLGAGLR